jgi:replicative DNA helicase
MNIHRNTNQKLIYQKSLQQDYTKNAKLQPQALEIETAVLGALMLERNAINQVIDILKPNHFYNDFHRYIYQAITELFNQSNPIDILTVRSQLEKDGKLQLIGGVDFLVNLTLNVNSSANIEYHAHVLLENSIRRDVITICSEHSSNSFNPTVDIFETLDNLENSLYQIASQNIKKETSEIKSILKKSIEEIENKGKNKYSGIPAGFTKIDRLTNGWQKSDLIILAARPGMGKTAFILNALRNSALEFGFPVAIFSLEMSSIQLVNRLISAEAEIPGNIIKTGKLNEQQWERLIYKTSKLNDAPIFIDDTPALSILELRAKARRLKSKHNIELLVIDYLQLMSVNKKTDNREQEISLISRSLKAMAKELNIPVIALSQLNRLLETRADKRPILSDLRESGAIEQDADQVIFLYRPSYYGSNQEICEDNDCEIIIAKNRNGALQTVTMKFIDEYTKFTD